MKVILGHFHFCYHFNIVYDSIIDIATRFSSPVRHFHQNSPFSHDEGSWIILKFGEIKNLSDARRAFRLKFFPKNRRRFFMLKNRRRFFFMLPRKRPRQHVPSSLGVGIVDGRCLPVYWSEGQSPVA